MLIFWAILGPVVINILMFIPSFDLLQLQQKIGSVFWQLGLIEGSAFIDSGLFKTSNEC